MAYYGIIYAQVVIKATDFPLFRAQATVKTLQSVSAVQLVYGWCDLMHES